MKGVERTSLADPATGTVVWSEGDEIKVFNDLGQASVLTLVSGAGTASAVFEGEVFIGSGDTYCAVTPSSLESSLEGGEWVIPQEKEVQVAELINEKDDMCSLWYAVKIKLMIVDEGSGREKAVQSLVMVRAEGLKDALSRTEGAFKDTMCDYEIVSIA